MAFRKKQILLTLPSPRRWWVRPIWQNRRRESEFHTSMPLLISGDTEYFQKYYKMRPEKFEELHSLVETPLTRAYLTREPLLSRARLAMTLRYLSSGMQIQDIALAFRVGISTAAGVIHSTCKILWTALQPLCLKEVRRKRFWRVGIKVSDIPKNHQPATRTRRLRRHGNLRTTQLLAGGLRLHSS
ncbi:uncharacterized protein ISCGN_020924 [Ixodes scapularis]